MRRMRWGVSARRVQLLSRGLPVVLPVVVPVVLLLMALLVPRPAQAGWFDPALRVVVEALTRALAREPAAVGRALAGDAGQLLAQGRTAEAIEPVRLLARLNAEQGEGTSRVLGQRLEQALAELDASRGITPAPTASLGELAAGLPLRLEQLPPGARGFVRTLQEVDFGVQAFDLVEVSVKAFARAFRQGADDPPAALGRLAGEPARLAREWLAVPRERRVFVIGAADDAPRVQALQAELGPRWRVFFYKHCEQAGGALCASSAVGGFFGSSGRTVVIESPSARASDFVRVEIASARRALGLQRSFLLLDTLQLQRAGARGGQAGAVVVLQPPARCDAGLSARRPAAC